jgi:hypothetical protein
MSQVGRTTLGHTYTTPSDPCVVPLAWGHELAGPDTPGADAGSVADAFRWFWPADDHQGQSARKTVDMEAKMTIIVYKSWKTPLTSKTHIKTQ